LFKRLVPREIFAIIKQHVIMQPTIRRNAKWVYHFQVAGRDRLLLRAMNHYEIHNVGREEVQNPVDITLNPLGGKDYRLLEATCVASDEKTVLVAYKPESAEMSRNVRITRVGEKTHIGFTVTVPPGDHIVFTTVYEREYAGKLIFDAQFTKMPIVDVELIVNFPQGYRFELSPHFSSDLRLVSEGPVQKIYVIKGGILPEQGFVFYLAAKQGNQKGHTARKQQAKQAT
jgi:hypothetical protein